MPVPSINKKYKPREAGSTRLTPPRRHHRIHSRGVVVSRDLDAVIDVRVSQVGGES